MLRCDAIRLITGTLTVLVLGTLPSPVAAQGTRGFDLKAEAVANGEERQRQPGLYVFEVEFKPMRLAHVNVTDPTTGEVQRKEVWYLCYRAVNRSLASRADDTDTTPVNALDPLPGPSQFIPEATLITYDQPGSDIPDQVYLSQIIPEASTVINQIERRRSSDPRYQGSVDVVQPVPGTVAADEKNVDWLWGVAMWTGVDPETDFFKVVLRGFSNGYEVRPGPDGMNVTWRKTIVQEYARRGDRYDPNQIEFEPVGSPEWIYLPDPAPEGQ